MEQITRKVSCIVCPLGCTGEVVLDNGRISAVSGFNCERGKAYAAEEVTAPRRMLTTTVRVAGGMLKLLPVASNKPLPKDRILPAARYLAGMTVTAPVREGQVICPNIMGLDVDIVAARDLAAKPGA